MIQDVSLGLCNACLLENNTGPRQDQVPCYVFATQPLSFKRNPCLLRASSECLEKDTHYPPTEIFLPLSLVTVLLI